MQLRPHIFLPLLLILGHEGIAHCLGAGEPFTLCLRDTAAVSSEGIFLDQIVVVADGAPTMRVRVADAPAFGQAVVLSRSQVMDRLKAVVPTLGAVAWSGAERITISRRCRTLGENELKDLLAASLQRDHVRDKGELQLRMLRAWTPVQVPDEPVDVKIVDLPTSGVNASFIVRFDLVVRREIVSTWQVALNAQVMREVWVTRTPLKRGQPLADLIRERRDLLALRDAPWEGSPDPALEVKESIPSGSPLYARAVGLRAVVHRGQTAEALLRDGAMSISLKVEVLEEGEPGQTVRVRNPVSRREFRGRVLNEQTIQLSL